MNIFNSFKKLGGIIDDPGYKRPFSVEFKSSLILFCKQEIKIIWDLISVLDCRTFSK